ncbi:hypothetical protein Hypma_015700 [Hypsizygus marmoreus]|uniref:Uncharacterized protein n=1 Tax=Hypsizygus marmoreus TaxID=39966 RepID=A0A369K2F8_HYPMA|nr:hypothetical protein Hypma_015700 [Hypsizygus marmoreus]
MSLVLNFHHTATTRLTWTQGPDDRESHQRIRGILTCSILNIREALGIPTLRPLEVSSANDGQQEVEAEGHQTTTTML